MEPFVVDGLFERIEDGRSIYRNLFTKRGYGPALRGIWSYLPTLVVPSQRSGYSKVLMDTMASHGSFNGCKLYINGDMEEERASIRWMNE